MALVIVCVIHKKSKEIICVEMNQVSPLEQKREAVSIMSQNPISRVNNPNYDIGLARKFDGSGKYPVFGQAILQEALESNDITILDISKDLEIKEIFLNDMNQDTILFNALYDGLTMKVNEDIM